MICPKCGVDKPLTEFCPRRERPGKFYTGCKLCRRIQKKKWNGRNWPHVLEYKREAHAKNPEPHRARERRRWHTIPREKKLEINAKRKAKYQELRQYLPHWLIRKLRTMYNGDMADEQHIRIQRITQMIEAGRMHAHVRHGMLGKPEIGIYVKDDISVWGELPADPAGDSDFAKDLLEKARAEAQRV